MSQFSHQGWGRFPSSSMMTVSRTCLLQNCTRIAVLVPALPGHPSTGQSFAPPFGNSIRYVLCSSPPVDASVHAHPLSLAFLCCVMRWESSDPAAISWPQSPQVTRSLEEDVKISFKRWHHKRIRQKKKNMFTYTIWSTINIQINHPYWIWIRVSRLWGVSFKGYRMCEPRISYQNLLLASKSVCHIFWKLLCQSLRPSV